MFSGRGEIPGTSGWQRRRLQRGFTLIELLVSVALFGVLSGVAVMSLTELQSPATNGVGQLEGFLKVIRARALGSNQFYRVAPENSVEIAATHSDSCSAEQTTNSSLRLALPKGASFADTTWSLCISPRGLLDTSVEIPIRDKSVVRRLHVVLGGGMRVL